MMWWIICGALCLFFGLVLFAVVYALWYIFFVVAVLTIFFINVSRHSRPKETR